jgi:hypothetical protein
MAEDAVMCELLSALETANNTGKIRTFTLRMRPRPSESGDLPEYDVQRSGK